MPTEWAYRQVSLPTTAYLLNQRVDNMPRRPALLVKPISTPGLHLSCLPWTGSDASGRTALTVVRKACASH
jgi:hypothetical protein